MKKYKNRSEVEEKYKWNLTDFFQNEKDYEEKYNKATKDLKELEQYHNCTKDSKHLYSYLEKFMGIWSLCQDLYVYSYLLNDQELGVAKNMERKEKASTLLSNFSNATSFFQDELLELTKEEYEKLFIENKDLEKFKSYLNHIYRYKNHVLDSYTENIITDMINATNHYEDIASNMLNSEHNYGDITLEGGKIERIERTNYRLFLKNESERVRKEAYTSFNKKIDEYSKTSAGLLNSYVALNNTEAKIHHFDSALSKHLFHLDISKEVYQVIEEVATSNLDTLHKYYKLVKQALGFDTLNVYDLNLNMSKYDKEYSIEEAWDIIRKALKPLGEEYLAKFEKIITNHYVDYCQYQGKCSGGYSYSTMLQDSRILMSYNYDLISVSTLIHEAGHNINHQFIKENNKVQYNSTYNLVAEVASLTNECLLSSYLAKNGTTKEEKLAGLENILDVFVSNFYGAAREAKIELDMYEKQLKGETLTKDYLDQEVLSSYQKYYGKEVKFDNNAKNAWVTRSHYYMDFYLYNYAICMSIASTLAAQILEGNQKVLEKYIKFLKVGSDKLPGEAFKVLGIDLENKDVYESSIRYFDSLINEYHKILNEEV